MFYSLTRMLRQIRRRKDLGVAVLASVIVLAIVGNSLTFYLFDRSFRAAEGDPITLWDGFWYSLVSITTIGYGDISSSTLGARIGTAFFIILVGLATFTTAVGMGVDWLADFRHKERTGMGKTGTRDHLIIVNFPGEARVRQIIGEYREDSQHKREDIVLVTDQLQELPFAIRNLTFIRGWPLDEETFARASIAHARHAIILSPSHEDPRSDSMVASIAFVMNNLNPEMRIVAECLDAKHAPLFNVSERVSLVYTLQIANNLLVQEAQDPGVTMLAHAITSNSIAGTLASTSIDSLPKAGVAYTELAKRLLDNGINLVGVIRDGGVIVSFADLILATGDGLVYISDSRRSWDEMSGMLS